jgi:hypothetical protein
MYPWVEKKHAPPVATLEAYRSKTSLRKKQRRRPNVANSWRPNIAVSRASKATASPELAFLTTMKAPPPMPLDMGCTTPRQMRVVCDFFVYLIILQILKHMISFVANTQFIC